MLRRLMHKSAHQVACKSRKKVGSLVKQVIERSNIDLVRNTIIKNATKIKESTEL